MAIIGPVVAQVGLQLLLEPACSSVVANIGCQAAGLIYPAYATCKVLDHPASPDKSHWLCYWLAFGGITMLEAVFTQRFPGYYHIKLLLLLWLQCKRYQGARRLYTEFLRPLLRKAQPKVDAVLSKASTLMERSDIKATAEHLHNLVASVPVLEWFVRCPAEESSLELWMRNLLS